MKERKRKKFSYERQELEKNEFASLSAIGRLRFSQ
jgi:hypothetical protein